MIKYKYISALLFSILFPEWNLLAQFEPKVDSLISMAKKQVEKKYLIPFSDCQTDVSFLKIADSITKIKNEIGARAVINDQLGQCYYNNYTDSFMYYQFIALKLFDSINNSIRVIYCLQNIAFKYENENDLPNALKYSQQALLGHIKRKDTASIANLLKYTGLLKGKLGQFEEGRNDVRLAIGLFNNMKDSLGLAVSYFDMGLIMLENNQIDSSLFLIDKAKSIWLYRKGNLIRLFIWNNKLIEIFVMLNDKAKSSRIFRQNIKILSETDSKYLDQSVLAVFFYNSYKFYIMCNDESNAYIYKTKYNLISSNKIK